MNSSDYKNAVFMICVWHPFCIMLHIAKHTTFGMAFNFDKKRAVRQAAPT